MTWWAFAKQFPKYAFVFGIIAGSTALFAVWWVFHSRAKEHGQTPHDNSAELASIHKRAGKAEALVDYLFLADDDLYEAKNGECLFKNWLHGDHPLHLFFDAKTKKVLGEYDRGFARYAFDGTREAAMMEKEPVAFCDGFKKAVFARNKNVWTAKPDWQNFKFINERQVTTIDSFYEQNFAANVLLLTEKTLAVRNVNNLLRVNLDTGNVKPMRMPLVNIAKQRSPDSRWMVGMLGNQFFCYDVDADEVKTIPLGRGGISDFQWLGNDKCVALAAQKSILVYDRPAHTLTENAALPFPCFKIGEPSPDGRFIFAAGGINGRNCALVDLGKKTAAPIQRGAGITWVDHDTFVFSRDDQDSNLRGTWIEGVKSPERRLCIEPYFLITVRPQSSVLPCASLLFLSTGNGLIMMEQDGINFSELSRRTKLQTRLVMIEQLASKVN